MFPIKSENVLISSEGVTLGGGIVKPDTEGQHPAILLHHGSGYNDRNGSRNQIRCHAEVFARNGFLALSYDKRGIGESTGDWRKASFEDMATDALAAMDYLKGRDDVQSDCVGIWGISQATWATAVIVSRRPQIPFAIIVGGAGFGMTVVEQVKYSAEIRLLSEGANPEDIAQIEAAWDLAFHVVRSGGNGQAELDAAVQGIREDSRLRNWTPPLSAEIAASDWMNSLPLDFDARPLWRTFQGSLLAIFGEDDVLLPVPEVVSKLDEVIANGEIRDSSVHVFPGADHGILAEAVPRDQQVREDQFAPGYFDLMVQWLNQRTARTIESNPRED